jgi:hypothetical protein
MMASDDRRALRGTTAMSTTPTEIRPPSAPPRVVAISGMVFAGLYIASLVLVRLAVPADPNDPGAWLADPTLRSKIPVALNLIPFTGIAFLWFMGVLRNRIGGHEDRFFSTVFLGSGLLFVAMLFVAAAVAQGLLAAFENEGGLLGQSETYAFARAVGYALMNTYAVKMAAVFIIVTSSIGLRTAVFPRWMVFVGYALALVMLLTISGFAWIALVFPSWVLLLSVYILVTDFGQGRQVATSVRT